MSTPNTTAIDVDVYSPAELSFLLAGRTSTAAKRAREFLGLNDIAEGDAAVLVGAQALTASGRAAVVDGNVELGEAAQMVGFILGTANKWVRVSVSADSTLLAMGFVVSPELNAALILRILPLGNVELKLAEISLVDSVTSLANGYLGYHETVLLAVRTDEVAGYREIGIERASATAPLAVLKLHGVAGQPEIADKSTLTFTPSEFTEHLSTVIGE